MEGKGYGKTVKLHMEYSRYINRSKRKISEKIGSFAKLIEQQYLCSLNHLLSGLGLGECRTQRCAVASPKRTACFHQRRRVQIFSRREQTESPSVRLSAILGKVQKQALSMPRPVRRCICTSPACTQNLSPRGAVQCSALVERFAARQQSANENVQQSMNHETKIKDWSMSTSSHAVR